MARDRLQTFLNVIIVLCFIVIGLIVYFGFSAANGFTCDSAGVATLDSLETYADSLDREGARRAHIASEWAMENRWGHVTQIADSQAVQRGNGFILVVRHDDLTLRDECDSCTWQQTGFNQYDWVPYERVRIGCPCHWKWVIYETDGWARSTDLIYRETAPHLVYRDTSKFWHIRKIDADAMKEER